MADTVPPSLVEQRNFPSATSDQLTRWRAAIRDLNAKLDALGAGASDAFLLARANHTGTQAAGTITGLAAVATSGLKADVGLGNVDNTSDANKPVSGPQQTALDAKASLSGAAFSGGVGFGSAVAASATDVTRHVALWGSSFGFSITSNRLNYVTPASTAHKFIVGGVDVVTLGANMEAACDITTYRPAAPTSGAVFLGNQSGGARYVFYDGSGYVMPGASLTVNGGVVWTASTFDPALKANLASPTFTGTINFPSVSINVGASLYMLEVDGRIRSKGSVAAFSLQSRDGAAEWVWYSPTSSPLRLNHSAGGDVLTITSASVCTAVTFTSTSDARLKDDVQPLKVRGALRPVSFRWNDRAKLTSGQQDIGFIAQEVAEIYPECVYEGDEGMLTLSYPKLVAALSAEVNELREELAAMRQLLGKAGFQTGPLQPLKHSRA